VASGAPESGQAQPAVPRQPVDLRRGAAWLVLCCYLAAAVAVTARLWVDPAGRLQVGDPHDVDLFAWYMRYAATAVSHGRLPALVTTALNPPQGVNLMWNTSFLLPGIVLTPVTLLAGPQTSLTLVLTLSLAGSAAAQAAIRAGRSWYKSSVRLVTPLRPASSDSQVDGTSAPTGVIAPSPVTTTFVRSVTVFLSGLRAPPASQVPHRCGLWPGQADAELRLT